jgi:protein-S-isoprenylcysteine O-methyltransferase Ste14
MDFPLLVVAGIVTLYWNTVLLLALYRRLQHGHRSGVVPKQRFERRLWRVIVPVVGGWIWLPWVAVGVSIPGLRLPAWALDSSLALGLRWLAAAVAVACYLLSLHCWLRMGRSWTMAIVPGQDTRLVTTGLYRWTRHPIYSLGMLLILTTAVVLPTVPMAVLAALYLVVLNLKARHEERHLLTCFGADYARYCETVGRFWPRGRAVAPHPEGGASRPVDPAA